MDKAVLGLAVLLAVWAGWLDWRSRRIPNWLTVPALLLGVALNTIVWRLPGTRAGLQGAGLALALLLPFVVLRGLGAGDWKLMGALGAFLGPHKLLVVLLGTILIAGLLASRYVYKQVQRAGTLKPMQTTQIVVAAERMALGARLQPHQLRLVSWPQDDPLPGSFTRIEDCTNRALITSLIENEPVLEGNLEPKEAGAGLPAVIPEGMRART